MFFAPVLNKRRVAADERPSAVEAWGPVVLDFIVTLIVLSFAFVPIMYGMVRYEPSDQAAAFFLFVLYAVFPAFVVINGCRWAYRARKRY